MTPEGVQFYQEFPLGVTKTLQRGAIYRGRTRRGRRSCARYLANRIDRDTGREDVQLTIWSNESMKSNGLRRFPPVRSGTGRAEPPRPRSQRPAGREVAGAHLGIGPSPRSTVSSRKLKLTIGAIHGLNCRSTTTIGTANSAQGGNHDDINRRTALAALGGAAALAMPYIRRAQAEAGTLNVYNWADYIGETTIEDFRRPPASP